MSIKPPFLLQNDIEAAREAYDAFLAHYCYCYGYWRKYADYEKRKGNKKKCEEVRVSLNLMFLWRVTTWGDFFCVRFDPMLSKHIKKGPL